MAGVRFSLGVVALATAVLAPLTGSAAAEDFRVENRVYVGDQKEPASRSITIFRGNMIYDCLASPAETAVLDRAAGRFILLDLTRRIRCELSTSEATIFVDRLQSLAAKSKDPMARFLADPKFDEHSDNSDELTFASPWLTYRVTLARQADRNLVEQYRDACDWYARLKPLLVPGSLPPQSRLLLDAALAQRQSTASRIVLTIAPGKASKQKTVIRSEHELVRPLDDTDLRRVAQTHEFIDLFQLVGFDQYCKGARAIRSRHTLHAVVEGAVPILALRKRTCPFGTVRILPRRRGQSHFR